MGSRLAKPEAKRSSKAATAPDDVQQVQRSAGAPAGMPQFLGGGGCGCGCGECAPTVQAKLAVDQPGDGFEQHADRIADMAAAGEQSAAPSGSAAPGAPPSHSSSEIPFSDSGSPLSAGVRDRAESALGADLGHVRVHDRPADQALARGLQAKAFTHGSNIWLGPQQSSHDVKLMAHESAHVVQQGAAPGRTPQIQRSSVPSPAAPTNSEAPGELSLPGSAPAPAPRPAPIPRPETCPPPEDMQCLPAVNTPGSVTNSLIFPWDSSTLTSAQKAEVDAVSAAWHAAGGSVMIRIDGYASAEGPCVYNWNLSCRRAMAVAAELAIPSDGSEGVPAASVELFSHGETDEFGRTLPPNRETTISIPTAPPAPTPITAPCPLPVTLGVGRTGCGSGPDFTHFDFPGLSLRNDIKLAVWAELHPGGIPLRSSVPDFECELEMDGVLAGLAGSAGHDAFRRFAAGSGGTEFLGASTTLGAMALASGSFAATLAAVKSDIESQLAGQAGSGALDPCALRVVPPATHFGVSDGLALKSVIGGTHGESLDATAFSGSIPMRSYSIDLRFTICDNFGVDESDLYAPGLFAFWVLQHERSATLYAPFINELDLPVTLSGTF